MTYNKALLVPINSDGQIFLQDRRGFKAPDWGFFGGSIEAGETPVAAVIREAGEELMIEIQSQDLIYLGQFDTEYKSDLILRHFYIYKTDQVDFDVREGKGGVWVSRDEAGKLLIEQEHSDELWAAIEKVVA